MTDYTPDPQALRALLDAPKIAADCPPGLDSHTWTASKICGVEYDDVTPEQRAFVKAACFGASPTGRQPDTHHERYSPPGLAQLADRLRARLGFVEGRRFDLIAVDAIYEASRKLFAEEFEQSAEPAPALYREGDRVMVQWDFKGDARGPYIVKHIDGVAHLVTVDEMRQATAFGSSRGAWRDLLADRALTRAHAVFAVDGGSTVPSGEAVIIDDIISPDGTQHTEIRRVADYHVDVNPSTGLPLLRATFSRGGLGPGPYSEIDHWVQHVERFQRDARRATLARLGTRAPKRKRPRRIARKLAARGGFAKYPTTLAQGWLRAWWLRAWCRP